MSKVMYTDYQISGNLRRAAKKGLLASLPKKQLIELTDKYFRDTNGILHCAYSWTPIDDNNDLEMEHIIPISRGGGTVLFNIVPCLSSINGMGIENKSTKNLLDWWEEKPFYKIELLENLVNYILEAYEISIQNEATSQDYIYEEDDPINKTPVSIDYIRNNNKSNRDKISYNQFLMTCIIKLKENGINVDSYQDKINKLQESKSFEFFEKERILQTELLNILKVYCPEYKYDITTSINYFTLLEKYKNYEISEIITEITTRISKIRKYCIEHNLNTNEIIHTIIRYQEFLWDENYNIEKLEEIALKRLNNLCDEIENFCIKFGWFPRKMIYIGNSQIKERIDLTEEELYEVRLQSRYNGNKKQLSEKQKKKIQQLKKEYSRKKIIDTNELYEEIVAFSNDKWFPRAIIGGIKTRNELNELEHYEVNLYSNYYKNIYKFTKEQSEQLEILKEKRNYFRVSLDKQYNDIVEFVEHNGHFPRTTIKEEADLYNSYLRNKDNFTKEQLDHLEELKKQNGYFDYNAIAVIEELKEFIKKYKRFPQSEIREDGIRLQASKFTKEQQYEVNLYAKYIRAKKRIPKKIIEELEELKERLYYDELYETILSFIDIKGHFPICILRREDGRILKTEELSPEEQYEKRLYNNYAQAKRKNKFTFEQITNLLELQKNRQIYIYRANQIYNQLIEFVNIHHRFPRANIWKNNQKQNKEQLTDEELFEVRLRQSYYNLKEYLTDEQQIILMNYIKSNSNNDFSDIGNKRRAG